MTRIRGAVLLAAIMSVGVGVGADVAAAQPQSAEEQAKAKFLAGKQSFRLGEYDEAIALWKEAYRLKDNPAFLFNIGLAYREKGDLPKAVQFLENYLKDAPAGAANRAEVEARVKELKKLIEDQKAAAKRPPNEPTDGDGATGTPTVTTGTDELDQKDQDGRSAAKLSTITLGIGAAAVVTGGVLFYLGLRKGKTESSSLSIVPHTSGVTVMGSF